MAQVAPPAIRRQLRPLAAAFLLLVLLTAAGCTVSPPPGSGDPGNVRLHLLEGLPVMHVLPPGGSFSRPPTLSPATWDSIYGGWNSPSVTVFIDDPSQSLASVYAFYANYAAAHGWHAHGSAAFGFVWDWTKTLSDGVKADLGITYDGPQIYDPTQPAAGYTLDVEMSAKLR